MWKVNRRRTPSDGKSSHCLWQGELKSYHFGYWSLLAPLTHFIFETIRSKSIMLENDNCKCHKESKDKLVLLWAQLTKIYPRLPTSVQPISITKTLLIVLTKNERDPPLLPSQWLFSKVLPDSIIHY